MFATDYNGNRRVVTLPASQSKIWLNCGLWASARYMYSKQQHFGGINKHEIADRCLKNGFKHCEHDDVNFYIDAVKNFVETENLKYETEYQLVINNVSEHCKARIDFIGKNNEFIHIIDFKSGYKLESEFENSQLLLPATKLALLAPSAKFKLTVIQPNSYPKIRTYSPNTNEIKYFENVFKTKAAESLCNNPIAKAGSHCYKCPVLYNCPATLECSNVLTEFASKESDFKHTNETMSLEYRVLKDTLEVLKYRFEALETEIKHALAKGENVPMIGYKETRSPLVWNPDATEQLKAAGFNITKETFLTPLQSIDSGVPEEIILNLSSRKTGKKLVLMDEKWARKALKNEQR